MELKQLTRKAKTIKKAYDEFNRRSRKPVWTADSYVQGLVGDVGDLTKLTAAYLKRPNRDGSKKIRHELADCLWSIIMIAQELGIDLEEELLINMDYLEQKLYERVKNRPGR